MHHACYKVGAHSDSNDHGAITSQGGLAYKLGEILCATVLLKNFGVFKAFGYILKEYQVYLVACDCECVYMLVCNHILYLVA